MILREVNGLDAPLIARLFKESFTETFGQLYASADLKHFLEGKTPKRYSSEIADPEFHFRLALAADGEPVGFVKLAPPDLPVETPPRTLELRQLYVLDRATGQGIGSRLLDWAIVHARSGGATNLQLSVFVDNLRARRLYEKRGFVDVGSWKFMVGSHADEDLIMRLPL